MGRTIPSYRIASEMERWKWRPFRKLLDKQDRKIFDEMLTIVLSNMVTLFIFFGYGFKTISQW